MPAQRHYGGHDLVVSVFSNILSRWHCWIEALLGGIPLIVATEEKADSRGRRGAGPGSCHTNTLATNTTLVAIAEKKTRTTTTQLYIIVATKEKADRATEALDQGLIIPTQLLQVRTAKLKNHKYKLRFVQIPAFVFKSKS